MSSSSGSEVELACQHSDWSWDLLIAASRLEVIGHFPVDFSQDVHEVFSASLLFHCVHKGLDKPRPILGVAPRHIPVARE